MEEDLNDEELEERLYSMLHHVDDTATDVTPSENALNVIKNAPQSTLRRYWRDDGPRTAPPNYNTPFQRVNSTKGGKPPFQNTPRGNNSPYQNTPKGINSPFQNTPKGNNSPFQNNPKGNNSPFQNTPKGNNSPFQYTLKGNNSPFPNTLKGNNSSFPNTPKGNNIPFQKVDVSKVPQKQNKEVKSDPKPKVEKFPEDPLLKHLSIFQTIAPNSVKTIQIIENDEDKAVELMSSDDDEVIEVALPPKPIISIDSSDDEISVALATPTKSKPAAGKGMQSREVSASPVASIVSSVSDDFIRGDCVAFNISRRPEKHSFDFSLHGADLDVGAPAKKKKKKKNKENATSTPIAANTSPSKTVVTDECFATPKSKAKNKKSKTKQYTVTETSIPNADVYDSDSNQSAIDVHNKNQNSHVVMQTSLPLSDIFETSNLPGTSIPDNKSKSIQNNDVNSSESSISLPKEDISVNTMKDSQPSITVIDLTDNQVTDNSIQENIVMANVTGFTESDDYHDEVINLTDSRIGSTKVPAILFDDVDFDNLKGSERSGLSKSYSVSTLRSDMQKFYNESWGGEEFSHREVQRSMSRDKSLWVIDMKDKIPMYRRKSAVTCNYCNRPGHRDDTCWKKPPVCFMCGAAGHQEPRCPNKICVNCGSPNSAYTSMCAACQWWGRHTCSQCRRRGHPPTHCDVHWRRFHHTIYNPHVPPPPFRNTNSGGQDHTISSASGLRPFRGLTHQTHLSNKRRNISVDNTQRQSKTPTRFEQRNHSLNNSQNFSNKYASNNEVGPAENTSFTKNKNSASETVQHSQWNPKTQTQRKSSLNEAPVDKNVESNDRAEVNSTANTEKPVEVSDGKKRNISATDYTQHTQRSSKTPSRQEQRMERRKSLNESPSDRNLSQNHEQVLDSTPNVETSNEEHIGKKRKISATDNTQQTQSYSKTPTRQEQKKRSRSEDSVENKIEDQNVQNIETDCVTSTEKAPDFIPISNNIDAQGRVIQDNNVTASNTADESDAAPEERPAERPEYSPLENNIPQNKNKALRKINTALASLNNVVGEPNALHKELCYLQKKHKSLLNQKVISPTKLQNSRSHIRDVASKLNLILVGQAGLAGGSNHVQELNLLKEQIVQIRQKHIPHELRTAVGENYHPIFSSTPRNDYWTLLNIYNSNKPETIYNSLSRRKKKLFNQKIGKLQNQEQQNQVHKEIKNGGERSGAQRRKDKAKIPPKSLGKLVDCWKRLTQFSAKGKRKGNCAQLARQLHAHIVSLKKNATTSAKNLKKILKIQEQANALLYGNSRSPKESNVRLWQIQDKTDRDKNVAKSAAGWQTS